MRKSQAMALALLAACGAAQAQVLLVPDWTGDRVMAFSPIDGSLVNPDFIPNAGGSPYQLSSPKEALQVGNEIWVSDQIEDSIFRFDLQGNYLSVITGGLDNIRGMEYADGRVYVANSGTGNGAPGDALVMFDPVSGANLGSFAVGDPFDAVAYQGRLVVSNIATDDLDSYGFDGTFLGTFHNSDGTNGIDFPQQVALGATGTILAAGFSSPVGLFEYDEEGTQINYWAVGGGNRGVYELANGNLMFTDGSGVYVYDVDENTVLTMFSGASAQYINFVVPAPGAAGVLAMAGLAFGRRRR